MSKRWNIKSINDSRYVVCDICECASFKRLSRFVGSNRIQCAYCGTVYHIEDKSLSEEGIEITPNSLGRYPYKRDSIRVQDH